MQVNPNPDFIYLDNSKPDFIYLDNAASTKPSKKAVEAFCLCCENEYGNPSALHNFGLVSEKRVNAFKETFLSAINGDGTVVQTSGATESNNLAIFGVLKSKRAKRIISTEAEHSSVSECYRQIAQTGFETLFAEVDKTGKIITEKLLEKINENTALISICHVNNETGAIQEIIELGRRIKEINPQTLFHVDASQSFCKIKIDAAKAKIDLLSVSGHKFHAIKGTGALYIKKGLNISAQIVGGSQQKNLRSGTENSFGAAAMTAAINEQLHGIDQAFAYVAGLNNKLKSGLKELACAVINSGEQASPYILNISFVGVKSEVLLHALEQKGIIVSAGSACSSKSKGSAILNACRLESDLTASAIRISFSMYSKESDIYEFLRTAKELIPTLTLVKER